MVENNIDELQNSDVFTEMFSHIVDSGREERYDRWNQANIALIIFMLKENMLSDISPLFRGEDNRRLELLLEVDADLKPTIMALAVQQGLLDHALDIGDPKTMDEFDITQEEAITRFHITEKHPFYQQVLKGKFNMTDEAIDLLRAAKEEVEPIPTDDQMETPVSSTSKVSDFLPDKKTSLFTAVSLFSLYYLLRSKKKKNTSQRQAGHS